MKDILQNIQTIYQIVMLEDHADITADILDLPLICRCYLIIEKPDTPSTHINHAVNTAQKGTFTGTAGSDYRNQFSLMHLKACITQRFNRIVLICF